jgi:A/G-specific adenine glycosylase
VEALAKAPLEQVLATWSGLGYYRRARSLHQAARIVAREHRGRVPDDPVAIRALPGVGEYTAGAILSIGFGRRVPVVDGNVERVLARLLDLREPVSKGPGKKTIRETAEWLVPDSGPGDHNQALMELGATLCRPTNPDCGRCPLHTDCEAHLNGDPNDLPVTEGAGPTRSVRVAAALIRDGRGRYLMVRREGEAVLDGFWEVPQTEVTGRQRPERALARALEERLGVAAEVTEKVAEVAHGITTRRIRVEGFAARLPSDGKRGAGRSQSASVRYFSPAEIFVVEGHRRRHPVSTVSRKLLESTHFRREDE